MTKRITILLSFFYLFISAGMFFNIHYCSGQLNHIEILGDKKHCECGHHEQEDPHCCTDKAVFIQFDTDQDITRNIIPTFTFSKLLLSSSSPLNFNSQIEEDDLFISFNLPPPHKQPIWLINSTFLFYG